MNNSYVKKLNMDHGSLFTNILIFIMCFRFLVASYIHLVYLLRLPIYYLRHRISNLVPITKTFAPTLYLTPLIKRGQIQEARNLSSVEPKYFLNVSSHTGFLTVDEQYDSNLFFWYFPVAGRPVNETPWLIWLQGGPGVSSLLGIFDEIGPFKYYDTIKLNPWSWGKDYSLLFFDNPVGTGYSFTNNSKGLVQDMDECSEHMYKAIQQFLLLFPEHRKAPLYIAGESYAGHYIPAIGERILNAKVTTEQKIEDGESINLHGLILGNPIIEYDDIADYSSIFYQWGFLDEQGLLATKPLQEAYREAIRNDNYKKASKLQSDLINKLIDITYLDHTSIYNVINVDNNLQSFENFLRQKLPDVSDAIHVGDKRFSFSSIEVAQKLVPDFLSPVHTKIERLLNHYRILIYCGQLDLIAPCTPNSEKRRRNWHWKNRDAFLKAARVPWWSNETVVGYVKSGGGLTEVLVRGAGHLTPIDKPAEVLQLVSYFIRGVDLPLPTNYQYIDSNTPDYVEIDGPPESKPANVGYIVSVVMNVLLVLVFAVTFWRLYIRKRRYDLLYVDSIDSISDGILTMT